MSKITQKQNIAIMAAVMAVLITGTVSIGNSYATDSTAGLATAKITPGDAATIAVNYIGAQPSDLVKVDLDKENGTYVYSVEIIKGDQEFDVELDPQTGQVLLVEQETVGTETDDDGTDNDVETDDDDEVDDDMDDDEETEDDDDDEIDDDDEVDDDNNK